MDPDLISFRCVQRHQRAVPGQHVHYIVDNDGIEEISAVIARGISPGDLQLIHVGFVDLGQRDVVRGVETAAIIHPGLMVLLGGGESRQQRADQHRPSV